ncbi:MAG: PQQ-binding-like beta-propeller repeat protein [Planctomycetes bacterium]|nr:PQQ-binding-like beta-propeller repeat protein [Planctomycetota bacterium]MBL7039634.1 PQQ-binding-like beta-propeller repeat protein [Pirellulaceae bacterium]
MRHSARLKTAVFVLALSSICGANSVSGSTEDILKDTGTAGGLVVHVGCGDGRLTAALHGGDGYLVQGLDTNTEDIAAAREHIHSLGLTGKVSVNRWQGGSLPYVDNLVNLVVVSSPASVARDEILRVLAPGGTAVFLDANDSEEKAKRITRPWPDEIDEWTHYLHGPDNNAVARDRVVGAPRRMQWVADPRWTRHHNTLNSISSVVTANGRLFYVVDEASPANLNLPGRWAIVARGAFNGVMLWKKPMGSWASHRQRFRSGPPQLPRLLVASGQRLYVPLGLGEPVSAIDAATGTTVATFAETEGAEEILLVDEALLVLEGDAVAEQALTDREARKLHGFPVKKTLIAVNSESGKTLWSWSTEGDPLPLTLASDGSNAYIRTDVGVICLDIMSGKERWRHLAGQQEKRKSISYGKENLLVVDGVVLCSLNAMLTALSAEDGKKLWECSVGSSFHEPVDVFVIDGLVWHKVGHRADPMRVPPDQREARDLHTGELKVQDAVPLHLVTPGHHFRCYRAKATERFIIMGKRGVEMVDLCGNNHSRNNWVRGTCQYGVMPANGLLYVPPTSCGCYSEAALRGFWAYASDSPAASPEQHVVAEDKRLEQGIAFGRITQVEPDDTESWPTYRQNSLRGSVAATDVPATLRQTWSTKLGGSLTQPVVAGGRVVLADRDAGIVYAVDPKEGTVLWKHFAGGRVDSPPTLHEGKVLLGSADGRVTCLRLADGAIAWRFLAAPADLRTVAFDRLESPWPVSGSVLVLDGVAYACAGRSSWIDGGMVLYALDPATGEALHRNQVRSTQPEYKGQEDTESVHIKGHLWTDYKTFTQSDKSDTYSIAGGLSDVPVSDGTHVFLRHLMFNKELEAKAGQTRQLFSTFSLLDGTEHHRCDWGLGTGDHDRMPAARHKGGFSQYHLEDAQKSAPYRSDQPTGLMLVHNQDTVWGVLRNGRGNPVGKYRLFRKDMDTSTRDKSWRKDLSVRPRAMLKSGDMLFLGVMPTDIPADDPHAAHDGRLGGSLWVCSEKDGSKIAEYALPAPVNWDGMAAADRHLYLSTADSRLVCMAPSDE